MKRFKYTALDAEGNVQEDEHTAASEERLIEYLEYNNLNPLSIEELDKDEDSDTDAPAAEEKAPEPAAANPETPAKEEPKAKATSAQVSLFTGISKKETSVFTRQLATTLHAGLPLLRTISLLHQQCSNKRLKEILGNMGKSLQQGAALSEAMAVYPRVFDHMYLNLVKVGEMSGDLPKCIDRLALLLEKDLVLRRRVKAALAYPAFIAIFTSILTYLLVAFLIPVFTPMFLASGLNLERDYPLTDFLIAASQWATDPVSMGFLIIFVALCAIFSKLALQTPQGRLIFDTVKISFPFLGKTIKEFVAARFARSFSTLLQAGVPLVESLSLVADAAGNEYVAEKVRASGKQIQSGQALADTLRSAELFPDLLLQMTAIGEEAGSLPEMLERVADYYDDELETSVAALTALLEPAMMVIIGGLVGVFVMGVLLPILGISSGMEGQL